jgi:hypothetical protein
VLVYDKPAGVGYKSELYIAVAVSFVTDYVISFVLIVRTGTNYHEY